VLRCSSGSPAADEGMIPLWCLVLLFQVRMLQRAAATLLQCHHVNGAIYCTAPWSCELCAVADCRLRNNKIYNQLLHHAAAFRACE
jgi:hypothetical protein